MAGKQAEKARTVRTVLAGSPCRVIGGNIVTNEVVVRTYSDFPGIVQIERLTVGVGDLVVDGIGSATPEDRRETREHIQDLIRIARLRGLS